MRHMIRSTAMGSRRMDRAKSRFWPFRIRSSAWERTKLGAERLRVKVVR
jgi:hypothetical protein